MAIVRDPVSEAGAVAGVEAPGRRRVRAALGTWCARRRLDRAWLLTLAAGLAVIMAYFVLPYGGTAQAAIQVAMCAASATAAAGAAARTRGLARVVWVWHAVGLTFLTMGTGLLYAYPFVAGRPLPYPSPADTSIQTRPAGLFGPGAIVNFLSDLTQSYFGFTV